MIAVPVELEDRSYVVSIGRGVRHQLGQVVASMGGVGRAAVVTQQAVIEAGWLEGLDPGVPFEVHLLGDGEGAKSLASIERLCGQLTRSAVNRCDLIVALGGGIVTDVGGFAAATYHRGVRYLNIATTLLGQVDAAVGGKTAVNLPEGKNLVGAFWQPTAVLCDTETLGTLPPREWRCGHGEMAKYALMGPEPDTSLLSLPIDEQVAHCVRIKAHVVASDETEQGSRAVLNYGHTLAHALEAEAFEDHDALAHGEAVAVGLVFAAMLARRLGRIDDARVEWHRRVVAGFGLSGQLPARADPERLVAAMSRDKKARHDLSFVLDGPSGVEMVGDIEEADVVATLSEMGRARS